MHDARQHGVQRIGGRNPAAEFVQLVDVRLGGVAGVDVHNLRVHGSVQAAAPASFVGAKLAGRPITTTPLSMRTG
jgi:hypothetical protein